VRQRNALRQVSDLACCRGRTSGSALRAATLARICRNPLVPSSAIFSRGFAIRHLNCTGEESGQRCRLPRSGMVPCHPRADLRLHRGLFIAQAGGSDPEVFLSIGFLLGAIGLLEIVIGGSPSAFAWHMTERPDLPLLARRIAHLPGKPQGGKGRWGHGQEEAAVGYRGRRSGQSG
jgi:hypothetical protein